MLFKRIFAKFGHKNSKKFLYDYYQEKLSLAIVQESKALHEYQNHASSEYSKIGNLGETYFLAKWAREELEKKVKQYA